MLSTMQLEDVLSRLCVLLVKEMLGDVDMMGHLFVDLHPAKGNQRCLTTKIEVGAIHPIQDVPSFTPNIVEDGMKLLRMKNFPEHGCRHQ